MKGSWSVVLLLSLLQCVFFLSGTTGCPITGRIGEWNPAYISTTTNDEVVVVNTERWQLDKRTGNPRLVKEGNMLVSLGSGKAVRIEKPEEFVDEHIPYSKFSRNYVGHFDIARGEFVLSRLQQGASTPKPVEVTSFKLADLVESEAPVLKWWLSETLGMVYVFYATKENTDKLVIASMDQSKSGHKLRVLDLLSLKLPLKLWKDSVIEGVLDKQSLVAVRENPRNCDPVVKFYPFSEKSIGAPILSLATDKRNGGYLFSFVEENNKWFIQRYSLQSHTKTMTEFNPDPTHAEQVDEHGPSEMKVLAEQDAQFEAKNGSKLHLFMMFAGPVIGGFVVVTIGFFAYRKIRKSHSRGALTEDGRSVTGIPLVSQYDDDI